MTSNSGIWYGNARFIINDQGAFFHDLGEKYPGGDGYKSYTGGTAETQAQILIHELGHLFGVLGSDRNNSDALTANHRAVDQNCRSLIESLGEP
jgi:hypothetical protein